MIATSSAWGSTEPAAPSGMHGWRPICAQAYAQPACAPVGILCVRVTLSRSARLHIVNDDAQRTRCSVGRLPPHLRHHHVRVACHKRGRAQRAARRRCLCSPKQGASVRGWCGEWGCACSEVRCASCCHSQWSSKVTAKVFEWCS